jgi:hypothetical protein
MGKELTRAANTKFPVKQDGDHENNEKDEVQWVSGVRTAYGKEWKNMEARMGRKQGSVGMREANL